MGLGPTEIIVILLIALLLFGPSRIAGVGRGLGDGIRSFKDGLRGMGEAREEAATVELDAPAKKKRKPKTKASAPSAATDGRPATSRSARANTS